MQIAMAVFIVLIKVIDRILYEFKLFKGVLALGLNYPRFWNQQVPCDQADVSGSKRCMACTSTECESRLPKHLLETHLLVQKCKLF